VGVVPNWEGHFVCGGRWVVGEGKKDSDGFWKGEKITAMRPQKRTPVVAPSGKDIQRLGRGPLPGISNAAGRRKP